MDRRDQITKFINKEQRGIEIGAYFAPLVPKREGYNSLSLDVFDTETLRERALAEPSIPRDRIKDIETVDLVGTSTEIESLISRLGLLGQFDYIVSSHNFEHLPNPVLFLEGCGRVLKQGGILSMAIPDKRLCFDHFRPHSTLSGWLEAWFEHRTRPTYAQVFDLHTLGALLARGAEKFPGFSVSDDPADLVVHKTLREEFEAWKNKIAGKDETYHDTHCWTFTPSSFALLISDLRFLGLCPLQIEEISEPHGFEFLVHLRNVGYAPCGENPEAHYARRDAWLRRINEEIAWKACGKTQQGEMSGDRINDLSQQVEMLKARVRDLEISHSWKITAPLRKLSGAMKGRKG